MNKLLILVVILLSACATAGGHPQPICPPGCHAVPLVPGDTLTGGVYRHGYKCVLDSEG